MSGPLHRRLIPPRAAEQFDEEISLHVELLAAEYRARGLSPDDALRAAERRIGRIEPIRHECVTIGTRTERRMWRAILWEQLTQDLRIGTRTLLRQRGWTGLALLTLALGIGACAAMYSLVDALLLHPVPYPRGNDVVILYERPVNGGNVEILIGPQPDAMTAWRGHSRLVPEIEPYLTTDMTMLQGGNPEVVHSTSITETFISFAGQHMLVGRGLTGADTRVGAPPVVVLAEGFWRRRFGGDRNIIGKTLLLDNEPHTVIGIAPRAMTMIGRRSAPTDVWRPLQLTANATFGVEAIGRLRRGVTTAAAEADLLNVASAAHVPSSSSFTPVVRKPAQMVSMRASLPLLSGAVLLVLLIACANVAHLLLARGVTRERELALRAALGAGRWRLLRQLLTESLALATLGWIAGLGVGWIALRVLVRYRPDALAELDGARMDHRVALVALALAIATGAMFGMVSAIQLVLRTPYHAIKAGVPTMSGSRGHRRLRNVLVVTEMAVSSALLVGAALLVRSVISLERRDPGFDVANLYALHFDTRFGEKFDPATIAPVINSLRHVPGVSGVIASRSVPPSVGGMFGALEADGSPVRTPASFVQFNSVTPGYFAFMRQPLVAGSSFTDSSASSTQVIVNQGFAHRYWPDGSALGRRLRLDKDLPWLTIVGIAADVATGGPISNRTDPILYMPGPEQDHPPTYLVRTRPGINPMPALRRAVLAVDPRGAPPTITRIADAMDATLAKPRFTMLLLVVFAGVAVLLAAIGLYGVLSYTVNARTREIGIRMALGATRGSVLSSVVSSAMVLALAGAVVGLGVARGTAHLIGRLLYDVPPTDPAAFAVGAMVMLAVAAAASVVPARRALRVDPVTAIRGE